MLQWHEDHANLIGNNNKLNADCILHAALEDDKVITFYRPSEFLFKVYYFIQDIIWMFDDKVLHPAQLPV